MIGGEPFPVGTTVLYKPPRKSRARRYTVTGYTADGQVKLSYATRMARGGGYTISTRFAPPEKVRVAR